MVVLPSGQDLIAVVLRSDYPAFQAHLLLMDQESHEQVGPGPDEVREFDHGTAPADVAEGDLVVGGNPPVESACTPPEMAPPVFVCLLY